MKWTLSPIQSLVITLTNFVPALHHYISQAGHSCKLQGLQMGDNDDDLSLLVTAEYLQVPGMLFSKFIASSWALSRIFPVQ